MFLACAVVFLPSIIFVFIVIFTRHAHRSANIVSHSSVASITALLNPPGATTRELLTARAIPNERLVHAFSLTNTFVSADPNVHAAFLGHAKAILRVAAERDWKYFQQVAVDAVEAALPNGSPHDFDAFIQDLTLRIALVGILQVDTNIADLDAADIKLVTSLVTRLWSLSKRPEPIPHNLLAKLNKHLRRLIPDCETYPNPLDYVIPVWETLWRVVATSVAYAHRNRLACRVYANMHALPTIKQFRVFEDSSTPSVEALIAEAMRLHPPSKHIARSTSKPLTGLLPHCLQGFGSKLLGSTVKRECADIESVLRSEIWGPDAFVFDPLRHHGSRLEPDQEAARSLVFGCGKHRCIAASWAPMAAGVIVATVLDRINEEQRYELRQPAVPRVGGREGWNGWSVVKC